MKAWKKDQGTAGVAWSCPVLDVVECMTLCLEWQLEVLQPIGLTDTRVSLPTHSPEKKFIFSRTTYKRLKAISRGVLGPHSQQTFPGG